MLGPLFLLAGSVLAGVLFIKNPVEEHSLTALPETSDLGLNTFGCLRNNEPWVAQHVQAQLHTFNHSVCLSLQLGSERLAFVLPVKELKQGVYLLDNPTSAYIHLQQNTDCLFTSDEFYQGVLTIAAHNEAKHTLSGTFEFLAYSQSCIRAIRVTHGRFDVLYSAH